MKYSFYLFLFLLSHTVKGQVVKDTTLYYDTLGRSLFMDNKGFWESKKLNRIESIKVKFLDNFGTMKFKFYTNDTLQYIGEYKSNKNCLETKVSSKNKTKKTIKLINSGAFGSIESVTYKPKRNGKWIFYQNNKIYKTIIYKEGIIISQK